MTDKSRSDPRAADAEAARLRAGIRERDNRIAAKDEQLIRAASAYQTQLRARDAEVARLTAELEQAREEIALLKKAPNMHCADIAAIRGGSLAWVDERDRLRAALAQARQTVAFFASVIKSGEPWTPHCEQALRAALSPESTPPAQPAGQPSGNGE